MRIIIINKIFRFILSIPRKIYKTKKQKNEERENCSTIDSQRHNSNSSFEHQFDALHVSF